MKYIELEEEIKKLKHQNPDITSKALFFAALKADEVEVEGKMNCSRQQFIGEKVLELFPLLEQADTENSQEMMEGFTYLHTKIQELPSKQKELFLQYLLNIKNRIFDVTAIEHPNEEEMLKKYAFCNTMAEVLEFPEDLIEWIYQVAKSLYEEKNYLEASKIFRILAFLHPLILAHHIGLALSYKGMQEYEIALFAFNTLTLAAPDNPMIRYHSASLYIELGQIPEALTELQALSKIIEQNQLHEWQSQYETLLKKAQI